MSFLVGCILIYHFDMGGYWYVLAAVWYYCEWHKRHEYFSRLRARLLELEERIKNPHQDDDED